MRNRLQAGSYLRRGAVAVGGLSGRRFLGGEEHGAEFGGGAGELGVDPMRAARGCVGGVGGRQGEREALERAEEHVELLGGEGGAVERWSEGGEGLGGEGGEACEGGGEGDASSSPLYRWLVRGPESGPSSFCLRAATREL